MTVKTSQQALNEILFQSYTVLVCFQGLSLNFKAKKDQDQNEDHQFIFLLRRTYTNTIYTHIPVVEM